MNKLILFDVDYTLINGLNGHKQAFIVAFEKVYGIKTNIDIIEHYGMTDQEIIIKVLLKNKLERKEIFTKLEKCMKEMESVFKKLVDNDEIILLPGVKETLRHLTDYDVGIGLITGNLEVIAREKLNKAGISSYFKFGGFGSDNLKRSNLVKIAIERAKKIYQCEFNDIFIIGDTPRDIRAGEEAGVKTIGVATGDYSKNQLKKAGANFVLESLNEREKLIRIIELKK